MVKEEKNLRAKMAAGADFEKSQVEFARTPFSQEAEAALAHKNKYMINVGLNQE